jgi:DNA-directed RNA polymerase specialized sigma subunit
MAKKKSNWDNSHFKTFAACLEGIIAGHDTDEEHYVRQKRQVETLCRLEKEFRDALIRDKRGPGIYKAFVKFVRDERRNILAARPYFRERQEVFKAKIAPALRERADKSLYKFSVNYPFISFAMKSQKFGAQSKVAKLARAIEKARAELIEMNIPLAISRARVFSRYSQKHLEYMDLVQVATEGLIAAIDKFVLPYKKSFAAVMYGRITGDLIEANSETLVHFYPSYKRLLYITNKMVQQGKSFAEIAEFINAEAKRNGAKDNVTNEHELQELHVAAYTVSGDAPGREEEDDGVSVADNSIHRFEADESWRPDVRYEREQAMTALATELKKLSLFEQKLLMMKGVDL